MNIKKGDKVKVIYGSQKGKVGAVEKVIPAKGSAVVSGVNMVKKHIKSSGIVDVVRPISLDKIAIVCPKCQKETRIGIKLEEGKRIRVCKTCQGAL